MHVLRLADIVEWYLYVVIDADYDILFPAMNPFFLPNRINDGRLSRAPNRKYPR